MHLTKQLPYFLSFNLHKSYLSISIFLTTLYCLISPHAIAQQQQPNIIFIMADDLGWGELNTYNSTFNETPNLNRLASQGIQFQQAYAAAPNCSPTRASLMTGQYPARVGITDFLPEGPKTKKYLKPEDHVTLNEALSELGYHTGLIGKWHLETHFKNSKGGPEAHGFDEVIGSETSYIANGDYFFPYDKVASYTTGAENEYLTDRQNTEAIKFIERNKNKPFFLYLSYYSVHTAMEAPEDLVKKYRAKYDAKYGEGKSEELFGQNHNGPHKDNPYLAAMLESIDSGIGRIMKSLEEQGLAENTLLVFFSDNGGAGKGANNGDLRGSKMWLYEGGIRVPLIMRWPKVIQAGSVEQTPVSSYDFYPTFLDVATGSYGDKAMRGKTKGTTETRKQLVRNQLKKQPLDGVSLVPILASKKLKDRNLYWHYPSETAKLQNNLASAVRAGDYKLLEFYKDNRIELYDLKKDPSETNNLVEKQPKITSKLKAELDAWKAEVNAEAPALKKN
ncbi:sulfatase [Sphingobacterium sp. 1.A.4]|uniref:sulfatase n=1 Tax=Sphingobacterium sp. 1.A.4 TaxID=2044603 RepID=UPI000C0BCD9D|nr:sulfatase [Sphingobacterium sp. 1.A.4]